MKMRIGVDARCLSGHITGIGRYVREILLCLDVSMPNVEWFLYSRHSVDVVWPSSRWHVIVDDHPMWRRLPGVLWVKYRLASLVAGGVDAFWATATLAPTLDVPLVSTVHDLNHVLVPETMPLVNRVAYRYWFRHDVIRATKVVTNSKGTARRLATYTGRHVDGVAVPGGRWASMVLKDIPGPSLPKPYILAVATREPRKNLENLVRAVSLLKEKGAISEHLLVLVGSAGWGKVLHGRLLRAPWIRHLGYVIDADMASLFANADLVAQPSIYEGFGMPVAEAAAFGTPVVANDIPELREAAGDTGVFTGPDAPGLAQGILEALSRPRPAPVCGATWVDASNVMRQMFVDSMRGGAGL